MKLFARDGGVVDVEGKVAAVSGFSTGDDACTGLPVILLVLIAFLLPFLSFSSSRAQELRASRRVETLPASSWMKTPSTRLRLGAGQPVLLEGASQNWLEARLELGSRLLAMTSLSLLRAGAFQLNDLSAGVRVRFSVMELGGSIHRLRREVEGVAAESEWRGDFLLVWREGSFRVGLRGEGTLQEPTCSFAPGAHVLAAQYQGPAWALGVSREDSPWQPGGLWRAGFSVSLSPSFLLAARGGLRGGALVLALRRGKLSLTAAIPVATILPAGPYFVLDWLALPKDGDG